MTEVYVITRQHINALRAMLAGGVGQRGRPMSLRRKKDLEQAIDKLEKEYNETKN